MGVLWCNEENGSHVAHAMREGGSCSCNAMGGVEQNKNHYAFELVEQPIYD